MQRMTDFQSADIGLDILWNIVDRTLQIDGVGNDVHRPASLHTRRRFRVLDVQGNADADGCTFAQPHEINMDRKVPHRIQMEVTRDDAVLVALQVDVVNRGEKAARLNALAQLGVIHRNGHGGLVVTIDHSRHSAGATLCPCGPLAACRTRGRLQFLDGGHLLRSLFCRKVKGRSAAWLYSAASLQGCGGCGRGGVLSPKPGNDKEMRGFLCQLEPPRGPQTRVHIARSTEPNWNHSVTRPPFMLPDRAERVTHRCRAWLPAPQASPSGSRSPPAPAGPCP